MSKTNYITTDFPKMLWIDYARDIRVKS